MWFEIPVVMNMIVCEVEQPRAYSVVLVHLVVAGGSIVVGIRGRLIPQRFRTWKYVAAVEGSLCDVGCVPSSSSSVLILDACSETVRCRSTPYLVSYRTWVDRCM